MKGAWVLAMLVAAMPARAQERASAEAETVVEPTRIVLVSGPGLDKKTIDAVIETQKKVGGIRPDKTPVTYERYTDLAIYEDALKLMQSKTH